MNDVKTSLKNLNNWKDYFGKAIDDSSIINIYRDNYKVKEMRDFTYIFNPDEGWELCFKNRILDAVFLYNQNINHFKRYELTLPYYLNWNLILPNVIEILGDTHKKKGGRTPICLNYPNLGLEINFLASSWDDFRNPMTSITIYKSDKKELCCSVCLKSLSNLEKKVCDNDCEIVNYCSKYCLELHLPCHKKYCVIKK